MYDSWDLTIYDKLDLSMSESDIHEHGILDIPLFKSNYFNFKETNETNINNNKKDDEKIDEADCKVSFLITNNSTMKKKEKIFDIVKKIKEIDAYPKLGRKKKRDKRENGYFKCHDKMKEDNIIEKSKALFIKSCLNFINKRHEDYKIKNNLKPEKLLYKIKSKYAQVIKKEENLEFFNLKLKQLFSSDLSGKIKKKFKDFNHNKIEELYRNNQEKEVIEILDKTVKELMDDYSRGIYKKEGFSMDIDLEEIKEELVKEKDSNIDEYLNKYRNVVINFGNIFENKISRRKKIPKAK